MVNDINLSFVSQQATARCDGATIIWISLWQRLTQEPIVAEVRTHEPNVEDEDESAPSDGQFFYDVEGIYIAYKTKYEGQSSEHAGKDDDDDEDDYFLVDEKNKIVKPDVDVHLFDLLPNFTKVQAASPKRNLCRIHAPWKGARLQWKFQFPLHSCSLAGSTSAMKVSNWGGHLHFREVG
ncbi:hypothetical protein Tco_1373123, partial [Tanacetum coccineum]